MRQKLITFTAHPGSNVASILVGIVRGNNTGSAATTGILLDNSEFGHKSSITKIAVVGDETIMDNEWTPWEQQILIDNLVAQNLESIEWNTLARRISQNPRDIYGEGFNNLEKADALVDAAVKHGTVEELSSAMEFLRSPTAQSSGREARGLDERIALEVGELYVALWGQLDTVDLSTDIDDEKASTEDFTEFRIKLRDKANFSADNQRLAVDSKNDNGVLRRKASKLGSEDKFNSLTVKVRQFYSQRILAVYPPQQFSADFRLTKLADALYAILPQSFQSRTDVVNHIYGVIFDATFQCLIFNE